MIPEGLPDFKPKLRFGVSVSTYLQNTCQVLALRWNPANSPPGTLVVPVMFHSIAKSGHLITDTTTISADYFNHFVMHAYQLGFETITVTQLVDFLNHNIKIPPRSLLMIVDDRRTDHYYQTYFAPLYQSYHWTVTNAWISNPSTSADLWDENAQLEKSGLVDHQAHGVIHNIPINDQATPAYIHGEIYGPIQAMLDHFGKRPIAFIWPQGQFTPYAVKLARQAGYELGFTAYARGPIMFNWIPLGSIEQGAADPLMVLPRYWSTSALADLDKAVGYSQAAQIFYAGQKQADLAYYRQYCSGYPPLPGQ